MREIFYRIPLILPALGLIFGAVAYCIDDKALWIIIAAIQEMIYVFFYLIIKKLYKYAQLDELTQVGNRHSLNMKLREELSKLERNERALSVLLVDIDDFKAINDTYGHIIGDDVITETVKIMKGNIRNRDSIFRFGGEEFIVILSGIELKGAQKIAERIRAAVENCNFISAGLKVTVSIGVAATKKSMPITSLIQKADEAMYRAKKIKNSVSC